jgi:hypothetical protein
MIYLTPSEYETYGLEQSAPAALVAAASSLIEAHCRRATLGVAQYVERMRLRPGRNSLRLTYLPLAAVAPATSPLVAAKARYAVPRRGEGVVANELGAEVAGAFGLPGTWTALDPAAIDFDAATGELSLPQHPLGMAYNELEATYTAGFAAIPDAAKFACAQIVRNAQATPALNVKSSAIERMQMEYFADSLVDAVVRALLAPFVAQKVG